MKYVLILITVLFFSCNNGDKIPDVSNIKIDLQTQRFEKSLFAIDSANFSDNFNKVIAAYPSFGENFISTILGADPKWSEDSVAAYVKLFIQLHHSVYDTSTLVFKDFTSYENEIKKGLQFVNYYFLTIKYPIKLSLTLAH
ncbi:MAG: hypothetical protein IPP48_04140 [Chitinophagaceae bacterium]|nr:hypothetical protein [Chitinophagaceae bacterium]